MSCMDSKKASIGRTLLAGIAGGMAFNCAMLLTFRALGFGWNSKGILMTSPLQSHKLIAVWSTLEPLPLVVYKPASIIAGIVIFATVLAFIYRGIARAWPVGLVGRALRFAGMLFVMTFLFWEFFTPYNQLGEPIPLILLELCFWAVIALATAFTTAAIMEGGKKTG